MRRRNLLILRAFTAFLIFCSVILFIQHVKMSQAKAALHDDWTTYQNGATRSGYQGAESIITRSTVSDLRLKWSRHVGGAVSVQPTIANGMVYWGSWDGYEHAFTTSGQHVWDTLLGQNAASNCNPVIAGVASSATYGMAGSQAAIFVGGGGNRGGGDGNAAFYALNSRTGRILWKTDLGAAPAHFIWSAPALYHGSIYIGMSSFGDCPLIQGQLYKLDAATGKLQATFNAAPKGCIGASIWGSPTITSDGKIYIATGNSGQCSRDEKYSYAVVELSATDLSVRDYWQVPPSQIEGNDSDFGSTPILFSSHGNQYVGVINKDGIFYTFKQNHLSAGPVWQVQIAGSLGDLGGNMSPAAWDGSTLYVSGGIVRINGTMCNGSINALDPANGSFIWRHCLNDGDRVLGPTVALPGVVIVGAGTTITMVNTSNGNTLFTYKDTHNGSAFYSGAAIAEGMIFQGNQDGYLFAFAPSS